MMYKIFGMLLITILYWEFGTAQIDLTMSEAARITMENNFGIQIARNAIRIAENNTSKENNGYLPTLDAAVGPTASFGNSTQNFSNDMRAETRNALTYGLTASVNGNMVLFDKARDAAVIQLNELVKLSDLELRQTIENTLLQLYTQFYSVAQLRENIKALEKMLDLTERRLERAEIQYDFGQGSRIDVLNARVDISRDSVNLLNALQQLENAKRDLNVTMGEDVDHDFLISTDVSYDVSSTKNDLLQQALEQNIGIKLADQDRLISELDLSIIDAQRKPKISANAGLNYTYQDNPSGSFISSSTSNGLNLGVSLNWNLFDGGRRKVQEQNVQVAMENQLIQKDQVILQLERDIENTWGEYQNALYVLEVEDSSLETSQANLERSQELFNGGQITSVELRQAQLNLLNSEIGRNNAKFAAKLVEVELFYLAGRILEIE